MKKSWMVQVVLIACTALAVLIGSSNQFSNMTVAATPLATDAAKMDFNTMQALFNYDTKADLNIQEVGVETHGTVSVHDITFIGVKDPIKAYLVVPDGNGPFAGILYVHWLGESPETTNRTEFLDEAIKFAPRGAVSLLVDAMWAKPGWYGQRVPEDDYAASIQQVIALRRAMDVLLAQPKVDSKRIAYVGHDFGAMYGAVMGGVDPRPTTYVLMAGTSEFQLWYLYAAKPKSLPDYQKQMSVLDPIHYIAQISNASFFFQYAEGDVYIPADRAAEFYNAAPVPKVMATYKADHSLTTPEVSADRMAWLVQHIGLSTGQ
jgi:cephalosporin-C deacetylase-like acetyl esterase